MNRLFIVGVLFLEYEVGGNVGYFLLRIVVGEDLLSIVVGLNDWSGLVYVCLFLSNSVIKFIFWWCVNSKNSNRLSLFDFNMFFFEGYYLLKSK